MEKITPEQVMFWSAVFKRVKRNQEDGLPFDWGHVMQDVFHVSQFKNIPDLRGIMVEDVVEDWLEYWPQPHAIRLKLDTKKESEQNRKAATLPGEEWRRCDVDENYYVSNLGRVWSVKRRDGLMKMTLRNDTRKALDKRRYVITIHKADGTNKKYFVHRLVAAAFVPNPQGLPEVDHINEDPRDNRAENLRWVTSEENIESYMKNHGYWYREKEGRGPVNL